MPENTVYVGRGTQWGNPYTTVDWSRSLAIEHYRSRVAAKKKDWIRHQLRGKNLACWCREDQTCHGDVLLEIANS